MKAVLRQAAFQLGKKVVKAAGLTALNKSVEWVTAWLQKNIVESITQVWSLSGLKVSWQVLRENLNQVSSVSLLMTSSTALANKGLFELTRRPSLTRAVSSFAETTEEPG